MSHCRVETEVAKAAVVSSGGLGGAPIQCKEDDGEAIGRTVGQRERS